MTLVAVLIGLAGGVGAGALGIAFDLYKRAEWFIALSAVVLCSTAALWILIVTHDASTGAVFAFLVPVLMYPLRARALRKKLTTVPEVKD